MGDTQDEGRPAGIAGLVLTPVAIGASLVRAGLELAAAVPRLVESLERIASFGDLLERVAVPLEQIAEFQSTLDEIGTFGDTLGQLTEIRAVLDQIVPAVQPLGDLAGAAAAIDRIASLVESLPSLADSIVKLEGAAGQLAVSVQPLQSAAQRLNRFVGGRKSETPPALSQ